MGRSMSESLRPPLRQWTHCTARSSDSPDALSRTMGWDEAQGWCNFVLMEPRSVSAGLSISGAEMRPEAPPGRSQGAPGEKRPTWTSSNRACHRTLISNQETTVRVKQFLYDWAPPAFDHPSLWRSQPRPQSFRVGDDIGWTGTDFRERPAAAIQIDRTTVEVAVIRGHLNDEGLRSICRGLEPVSLAARERIIATPLAALCYQARYAEATVEVPTGYWRHQRNARKLLTTSVAAAAAPDDLPGRRVAPKSSTGYKLDSVFIYRAAESGEVVEADFVYEMPGHPGRYLRILASRTESICGLQYPPTLDEQQCNTAIRHETGAEVHHAYLEDIGPHEALWQQGNENILLLCKPTSWTDREWLKRLLADLTRPAT